jgi:predicted enzyme related to lactoylglutathione lyase
MSRRATTRPDVLLLNSPDSSIARAFYTAAFGWTSDGPWMSSRSGTVAMVDLPARVPTATQGWIPSFSVTDVAASVEKAIGHGGASRGVVSSAGCEWTVVEDTEAVPFALSTVALAPPTSDLASLAFLDLYSWGTDDAVRLYETTLDATVIDEAIDDVTPYRLLVAGDRPIVGIVPGDVFMPGRDPAPHWLPYFRVADLRLEVARMVELGAHIRVPHTDTSLGEFAVLTDPNGTAFGLQTPGADDLLLDTAAPRT